MSYPLYLVHPIIFFALRGRVDMTSVEWLFVLIAGSLVAAFFVDKYVDAVIQKRIKFLGW